MYKNLLIREALENDLPHILKIYGELTDDPEDKITMDDALKKFEKFKVYPDYKLYVAVIENVIVGTFALLIMDNLAHRGEPSSIVEDVAVSREWQGKGIGKEMMQYAMNISRLKGCYKMVLSSHFRRADAHKFYESLGFKKHGFSFTVDLNFPE